MNAARHQTTLALTALLLSWLALNACLALDGGHVWMLWAACLTTVLIVLEMVLVTLAVSLIVHRWPIWWRVGLGMLPSLGLWIGSQEFGWRNLPEQLELSSSVQIAYGGALGLAAAFGLRRPRDWDEDDILTLVWNWLMMKSERAGWVEVMAPPRFVSGLCLFQIFFIFLGTSAARVAVKRAHQLYLVRGYDSVPRAVAFISSFGYCFLLATVAWCGWAVLSAWDGRAAPSIGGSRLLVGAGYTFVVVVLFFYVTAIALES